MHNYLRWVALAVMAFTLYRSFYGWVQKRSWQEIDNKAGLIFTSVMDTQLLLGLLIFGALNFSVSSQIFTEHIIPMAAAVILAHVGRARSKGADPDQKKHRISALWYTAAMLVILLSIPWYRPLLRGI